MGHTFARLAGHLNQASMSYGILRRQCHIILPRARRSLAPGRALRRLSGPKVRVRLFACTWIMSVYPRAFWQEDHAQIVANNPSTPGGMDMQTYLTRRLTVALSLAFAAAVAWMFFYHECASGGAMGGWYRDCKCLGTERVDFDNTAVDGPLRTVCYGWVTARTCYRDRGGLEMPCEEIKQ